MFGAGIVYVLDCVWFVRVGTVWGRLYARVYGVWWWTREVRRAGRRVRTRGCMGGCVSGVCRDGEGNEEGDDRKGEEGVDERW